MTGSTTYNKSFKQAQFFGVVPTAAAINGTSIYQPAAFGSGAARLDGVFGYANGNTGLASPSLSQTAVDHLSDVILVADAGAYDMGLLGAKTSATATNATTTAGAICFAPYSAGGSQQWSGTSVYAGPWGRKNKAGAWSGGPASCSTVGYTTAMQGLVTYCAVDGSAKSVVFNDTATTEIYTLHIGGSVRCV